MIANELIINSITVEFIGRFMKAVIENKMHLGNVDLNMAADSPFMQNWIHEWRAHNYSVRDWGFIWNTYIAELHINAIHGGVKCLLVAEDTSVLQGTNFITPKPAGVSLQDYHDHFRHVFGDSEARRGTWELFPNETAATIDVAAAKAKLPKW